MSSRAPIAVGLMIAVAAAMFQLTEISIGVSGIVLQMLAAFAAPLVAAAFLASDGEDALEGGVLLLAGTLVVGVLLPILLLAAGLAEWAFRVPVLPIASVLLMTVALRRPAEAVRVPALGLVAPLIAVAVIVVAAVAWSSHEQRHPDHPPVLLGLAPNPRNRAQLVVSVDYLGRGAAQYVLSPSWLGRTGERRITVAAGHGWTGTLPLPRSRADERVLLRRATGGAVLRTVIWQVGDRG